MTKYKYVIIVLTIIVLLVLGILVYTKYFEEQIIFSLFGDKEITLYEGADYVEYGYVAINEEGDNLNDAVRVNTNLNTNRVGEYEIEYQIKVGMKTYRDERKVYVIEDLIKEITFELRGSSIVNLQAGDQYDDPRFTCIHKETGKDMSRYVIIENSVNYEKEGVYEIIYRLRYNGQEKILRRQVYVHSQKNSHSMSTTSLTNKPVSINFKSNIYNFAYVICPNETIEYSNDFTYNFFENGRYSFYVFDTLGNYEEYIVAINNIDRVAPTGTCTATLMNGETTYSVKSNDDDIAKYLYNNEDQYAALGPNYVLDVYHRDAKVMLIDKAGNKTLINCEVKRTYKKALNYLNKNEVTYSAKSDSLIVNISNKDGYYLTHIWAKDPYLQMQKEMIKENSKSLKLPRVILEQAINTYDLRSKIVIGGNASAPVLKGSHYDNVAKASSIYNLKEPSALLVYKGNVIINDYKDYVANTVIYYMSSGNKLSYIPIMASQTASYRKNRFKQALDSGIYNTFAFNYVLVKEGKAQSVSNDYYALRNGFCQLDENNFLWVVSDTKRWNRQDFANFMAGLGCETAVNFDGGGSVALFYKDDQSGSLKTLAGNQRALSSVMYFTELD